MCAAHGKKKQLLFFVFYFLAPEEFLSDCILVYAKLFFSNDLFYPAPARSVSPPLPARLLARSEAERPLGAPGGGAAVGGRPGGHLAGSLGRLPVRRLQETPVRPPLGVPRPLETPRVQVPVCVHAEQTVARLVTTARGLHRRVLTRAGS